MNFKHKIDDWRYERKFICVGYTEKEIETLLKFHPAIFSEIYTKRKVNNIYFDTFEFNNFIDNQIGANERIKVRIRWYGPLFGRVEKSKLEIKIKKGELGYKLAYALEPFEISKNISLKYITRQIRTISQVPEEIKNNIINLEFSLLNSYERKYFQSADRAFRFTIDTDLKYYRIKKQNNTFLEKITDHQKTIVELKYNSSHDLTADTITRHFPFRISKSSKYVMGIDHIYY